MTARPKDCPERAREQEIDFTDDTDDMLVRVSHRRTLLQMAPKDSVSAVFDLGWYGYEGPRGSKVFSSLIHERAKVDATSVANWS